MDKAQRNILILCVAAGLLLGVSHRYLLGMLGGGDSAALESQPLVQLPAEGLKSDAFSLRLFQAALALQEKGSCCVAPLATHELLGELHKAAGGSTREQLAEVLGGSSAAPQELAASRAQLCALFVDDSLAPAAEGKPDSSALPVPMKRDTAKALSLINGLETQLTLTPYGHFLSGEDISADSKLIAVLSQSVDGRWLPPMHPAPAHERDFYGADGGVLATDMLMSSGTHTLATAEDGSWQAAALFLHKDGLQGNAACYIAIMPKGGDPRAFARSLTPEKLSEIRTALAKASPKQATIYLPSPALNPAPRNLQALLLELGLGKLFTQGADFTGLSTAPLHLDHAAARYVLGISGTGAASAPAAGEPLRFNQPYVWLIADLVSDTPPLYIGWEEGR